MKNQTGLTSLTSSSTTTTSSSNHGSNMERSSASKSRSRNKRRPASRSKSSQHSISLIEGVCDPRTAVNGVVSADADKMAKLVKKEPIENFYEVEQEPFASGLFATVRKCRHLTTGIVYAAKYTSKIRYGTDCTAEIHHEIGLMTLCVTNKRIIHLVDVFDSPTHMILVMEYAPGGDLQTLMDEDIVPYERDAVKFVRQVLEGLVFLHDRNIAHLDIKLQNVLLLGTFPGCDVKLCDLEISRVILQGQEVRELLGTPDYVSPEILHYEPITLAADIWSVGVMAYVLLTGFTPFGGDSDQETFNNICQGQLDFPEELFEDISTHAEDFIRKTLSRNPSSRPTARECLKHPWLTSWKNVASHQKETISSENQRKTSNVNGASCPRSAAANNGHSSVTMMPQSLQRCMSKSREVLYERVASSNLRKSTSKSRERLFEMRLSMSRSRDHLCELQRSVSQSRDRLQALRNMSKSHEVLSLQLDGNFFNGSLYHLLNPSLTHSLECFTIPPLSPIGVDGSGSSLVPPLVPPQMSEIAPEVLGLSKAFSESTETLCDVPLVDVSETDNKEGCGGVQVTEPAEDITPSNSRSATPTQDSEATANVTVLMEAETPGPETSATCTGDSTQDGTQAEAQAHVDKEEHDGDLQPVSGKQEEPVLADAIKGRTTAETMAQKVEEQVEMSPNRLIKTIPPPLHISSDAEVSTSPSASVLKSPVWSAHESRLTPSPKSPNPGSVFHKPPASPVHKSHSKEATSNPASSLDQGESHSVVIKRPAKKIDTTALSEDEKQLLPAILNRRRASWAYGSRQEELPGKKNEPKLSVAELINAFSKSGSKNSSTENLVTGPNKPVLKKAAIASVFSTEGDSSSSTAQLKEPHSPKVYTEKEKSIFKPLSSAIQQFEKSTSSDAQQKPAPSTPTVRRRNSYDRGIIAASTESSSTGSRGRPHNFLWEVRALPRLPEDSICSPREETAENVIAEHVTSQSAAPECPNNGTADTALSLPADTSGILNQAEDKASAADDDKCPITSRIPEQGDAEDSTLVANSPDAFLRSGSVSSDTGCSEMSGSDISDRSSDGGHERPVTERRGSCIVEDTGTIPYKGRPRSFSVQTEVSFIAQPWNKVCTGAVARAFEKFGTKVVPSTQPAVPSSSVSVPLSRRQSTSGLKP